MHLLATSETAHLHLQIRNPETTRGSRSCSNRMKPTFRITEILFSFLDKHPTALALVFSMYSKDRSFTSPTLKIVLLVAYWQCGGILFYEVTIINSTLFADERGICFGHSLISYRIVKLSDGKVIRFDTVPFMIYRSYWYEKI